MDALLAPLLRAQTAGVGESEISCDVAGEGTREVIVRREFLRPAPSHEADFPYPWPFWKFLDAFPETVAGDAPPLAPLGVADDAQFDLIILGYPVWFLSPPPVMTAFLRSEKARALLHGRPVVTVTACRNMWLMAQERVKELLRDIGARHIDHVALTDQGNAFATFITTPRWMFTGRKNSFWGLPPAGVPTSEITVCDRFGRALLDGLRRDAECENASANVNAATQPAPLLSGLRACTVDSRLIASERIGIRSFRIWSKILRACGSPGTPLRRVVLFCYMCFLLTMIVTVVPLSFLIKLLLRPLLRAKLARLKHQFEQPSGSGCERLAFFAKPNP